MEWGMIMALFTVVGMMMVIFGEPSMGRYQTFGREVLNRPETDTTDESEMKRAA